MRSIRYFLGENMIFTEEMLKKYARPLSETEEAMCKNAINMVMDALKGLGFNAKNNMIRRYENTASFEVKMSREDEGYDVKIFLQGSYANNTNVRGYSDVDIAVVQEDRFIPLYRPGISKEDYGFLNANPNTKIFKDLILESLRNKFFDDVVRKNKSIKINGNTYRKDTDVVPAMRYRDYSKDEMLDPSNFTGGIQIDTDNGDSIINYPEQHIKNGIEKNKRTNYYFKKMVRIGKEIRYQMNDLGYKYATDISSFGIESLFYNVPDYVYLSSNEYRYIFQRVIDYLYFNKSKVVGFYEINGIKELCKKYSEDETKYLGFIDELKKYYEYEE